MQALGTVRFNTERMVTLDNDLLDIGRIETGKITLNIKPDVVKPIILETVHALQIQIDERQLTVEYDVPDDLPPVLCDRKRLVQVLTNLVSNAYKYTPAGGQIAISVSRQRSIQPSNAPRGNSSSPTRPAISSAPSRIPGWAFRLQIKASCSRSSSAPTMRKRANNRAPAWAYPSPRV